MPFAYKDPRFSFTLGALAPLLPENTVYICVFRDAREVAESTRKHAGTYGMILEDEYCFAVWEAHYLCILEHRRRIGGHWLFVSHQQLMEGIGIRRMEQALQIPLDRSLVRKELKRSQARGILPPSIQRLSEQLEDLSTLDTGHSPEPQSTTHKSYSSESSREATSIL